VHVISILGIVLSLGLLITLAYRGVSVLLLAPLTALLAVAFGAPELMLASYTQIFMVSLGGFVIAYFPLFLLGAVFGKLMEASGRLTSLPRALRQHWASGAPYSPWCWPAPFSPTAVFPCLSWPLRCIPSPRRFSGVPTSRAASCRPRLRWEPLPSP
jgi:hypothetical protein